MSGVSAVDVSQQLLRKHKIAVNDAQSAESEIGDYALVLFCAKVNERQKVLHSKEKRLFVLVGHPYWQDEMIQTQALSEGQSKALESAYLKYDLKLFQILHGEFTVAIVDAERKRTILAVDRMGVGRLCYSLLAGGKGMIFGTGVDMIRDNPKVNTSLSVDALYSYLYFNMVPSPNTIYEGIQKLRPGQYLEHTQNSGCRCDFYWRSAFNCVDAAPQDMVVEMKSVLDGAVQNCMEDGVGTFLSGGLDSSTVTGIYAKRAGSSASAYSIGFDAEGYDEMRYAKLAAEHFGVKHRSYYVTPKDVLECIPIIANAYDEPFGNSSAVPAYYCAKLAKENGIHTLLAGDGGDELFAGNARYAKQKLFERYRKIPEWLRQGILDPLVYKTKLFHFNALTRKLSSYIKQANIPLPDRMETYNTFHRNRPDEILHESFLERIEVDAPLRLIRQVYGEVDTCDVLDKMLYLDWKHTLADNDIRKVNTMCKAAGVNVRYPMLDDHVVEFSTRIPGSIKLKGQNLRSFYKSVYADFLPPEIISKTKHGFGLPFGVWMLEYKPLQEFAYDALTDLKKRNYLHSRYLDNLIIQHQQGHAAYYGEAIWVYMLLEQWLQRHAA